MSAQVDNPSAIYLAARREWNERYGSYISRAKQWRAMAFILAGTTTIATCCAVWLSSQTHVVPYIVRVDRLGEAVAVHRVPLAAPADTAMIRSQLARFIVDIRTVYADPIAAKNIGTEAFGWVDQSSDAKDQLTTWFTQNNPAVRAATETVGVAIESVGQIGAETWSVDWSEEHRTRNGTGPTLSYWRASIRIKIDPPTDDASILANPAGVFITWFTVTPRLG